MTKMPSLALKIKLLDWYRENHRPLPWRSTQDPYPIWLSETMLQQTTVAAVQPYFHRFLERFPTLESLADASEPEVLRLWSGLGYYSRAKRLRLAAQTLVTRGSWPRLWEELIEIPGFGPYTARAVASLAFGQKVGVLDGNVIRFLSRFHGLSVEWWKPQARRQLQELADQWVQDVPSAMLNQALMEMGATLCTPKSPTCILCPLLKSCQAHEKELQHHLPPKKPRQKKEIWEWTAWISTRGDQIALTQSHHYPFLKKQWCLPGRARKKRTRPKEFQFLHHITHHDIYVTLKKIPSKILHSDDIQWIERHHMASIAPFSLVQKALAYADLDRHHSVGMRTVPLKPKK